MAGLDSVPNLQIYMHAYIHTYMHAYIHTYIHAYIHTGFNTHPYVYLTAAVVQQKYSRQILIDRKNSLQNTNVVRIPTYVRMCSR